jgi:HEAT repeat protein
MTCTALLLAVSMAPAAFAQPAALQNAHVEKRSAAGGLSAAMQNLLAAQSGPAWIGYEVPAIAGRHSLCCYDAWQCYAGCSLEGRTAACATPPASPAPVYLEGPKQVYVFYRIDRSQVDRVRVFSPDCSIDAGGLTLYWFSDVQPAASIAYLAALARNSDRRRETAIMAIALHAAPEAAATLTDMARNGPTPRERSHALAWLARTAPPAVSQPVIDEALAKDSSAEVKHQAVFALTQIPHNDGVPRLIELARASPDPAVRKQAMFWLGRSKDERAYKFFEEVLTR